MPFKQAPYIALPPATFMAQYSADTQAVLLDVRTHSEYTENHLPNALLIDIKQNSFVDELNELDKTLPYYVYCRVGVRSANACQTMRLLGFTGDLYNLQGGINALPANLSTF